MLTFKNFDLRKIAELTKASTAFRIPYEGEKTQPKPTMFLCADAGIYICPSVSGLSYPLGTDMIAYAVNNGPTTTPKMEDGIYEVVFSEQIQAIIEAGHDLVIDVQYDDDDDNEGENEGYVFYTIPPKKQKTKK